MKTTTPEITETVGKTSIEETVSTVITIKALFGITTEATKIIILEQMKEII